MRDAAVSYDDSPAIEYVSVVLKVSWAGKNPQLIFA